MEDILTIDKPQECFQEIEQLIETVFHGFMALAMDYGYHINNVFGKSEQGKHAIYELRDNIHYRLNSAKLHFYLLLKRKMKFEALFESMLKEDSHAFDGFYRGNPHFEHASDEIMSLYDSIIFHLSSAFDYLAMLLQFVFGQNPQEKLDWGKLVRKCRDENEFANKAFKENIEQVNREFVSKFNDYRAELIHRRKSTAYTSVLWELASGDVEIKFRCSEKIKSYFKSLLAKGQSYCITYLTSLLIKQTILKIGNVLEGVKNEFQDNYDAHNPKMDGPVIAIHNPTTNRMESPSVSYWSAFMRYKNYSS